MGLSLKKGPEFEKTDCPALAVIPRVQCGSSSGTEQIAVDISGRKGDKPTDSSFLFLIYLANILKKDH